VRLLLLAAVAALLTNTATAQFVEAPSDKGPKLDRQSTVRIKVGVVVKANGGLLHHIVATAPVPTDWPEQRVSIAKEDVSSAVKSVTYRNITGGGGLKQMVVEIPQLPPGVEAHALVTFELARSTLAAPSDTSIFKVPKKVDRGLSLDLGPSPYIESRHPKIVSAAKEAVADKDTDWQKVEAIYDWVREHVTYSSGELKGAARALYEKKGDTDELTSLFIAMCRANKIPARTVFVPGHCYAEFYLLDDDGEGHWFPCQPAGARSFGAIDEVRPILQKGDNFKNPENPKERQRFVTEYFTAAGRGGKPDVKFFSELVAE
jgi:hypothetical protein